MQCLARGDVSNLYRMMFVSTHISDTNSISSSVLHKQTYLCFSRTEIWPCEYVVVTFSKTHTPLQEHRLNEHRPLFMSETMAWPPGNAKICWYTTFFLETDQQQFCIHSFIFSQGLSLPQAENKLFHQKSHCINRRKQQQGFMSFLCYLLVPKLGAIFCFMGANFIIAHSLRTHFVAIF